MKRGNIFKTISILASIVAFFTISPAVAWADGESSGDGVHMYKDATFNTDTKEGTITLQSFVEGEVRVITKAIPADVVLILDCTKSMTENGDNFTPMKNAALEFIKGIYDAAVENSINHRISIVQMATQANLWCDFTSVISGKETLDNIINKNLTCEGTVTRPDRAFNWATALFTKEFASEMNSSSSQGKLRKDYYLYNNSDNKPSLSGPQNDAAKFVLFFTDGIPTSNDSSTGSAPTALKSSKTLKMSNNVTVYSVGLFGALSTKVYSKNYEGISANASELMYARTFLNSISSNYPDVECSFVKDASGKYTYRDTEIKGFFMEASNSSALKDIFSKISKEIKESVPAIQLGTEVTLKDFINKTYFKLPDGTQPGDIKTYTVPFNGFDKDKNYTFDMSRKAPISLTVNVLKDDEGYDYVTVKGFNFSENFCGMEGDKPRGYEVLVTIPFVFNGPEVSGELETNTRDSGIYTPPADPEDPESKEQKLDPYPVPAIKFCTLNIIRQNLLRGETAIYTVISNTSGKEVCRVSLSADEDGQVIIESVAGLPEGNYKVVETSWNWAYKKEADSSTGVQIDSNGNPFKNVIAQFKKDDSGKEIPSLVNFNGRHIEGVGDEPAEMHNHDESFKENVMQLPGK